MREDGVFVDRRLCTGCGDCAAACPANAMRLAGTVFSVDELVEKALIDKPYYQNSSGGVTLSGGEPLSQADAALCILASLKERGVHTAVETCGFVEPDVLERVAPYVDQFMFDYKLHDPEAHRAYTGVDNGRILSALRCLHALGANVLLRLPLIPGINMDESHYAGVRDLVNELRLRQVEVLPFHQYGKGKYAELGMDYRCAGVEAPDSKATDAARAYLKKNTAAAVW